jgi:hypothetical protein
MAGPLARIIQVHIGFSWLSHFAGRSRAPKLQQRGVGGQGGLSQKGGQTLPLFLLLQEFDLDGNHPQIANGIGGKLPADLGGHGQKPMVNQLARQLQVMFVG